MQEGQQGRAVQGMKAVEDRAGVDWATRRCSPGIGPPVSSQYHERSITQEIVFAELMHNYTQIANTSVVFFHQPPQLNHSILQD